jgi:hypothetical protein
MWIKNTIFNWEIFKSTFCPSSVLLVNLHEDCQPSTMVEKQRLRGGSKFSLTPKLAAALQALPPRGYDPPPALIKQRANTSDVIALRARNYATAYKALSVKEWNSYVSFGIQQKNPKSI